MSYVLIACEESQRVCEAFRKVGHTAFSADLKECSGGYPEWHVVGDVTAFINGGSFTTMTGCKYYVPRWDLIIAHPPCTYLTHAATRHHSMRCTPLTKINGRTLERIDAMRFFMLFATADCEHIAIENPVGVMNTAYRQPDQKIHPYMFASSINDVENYVTKGTCLWLKGLPVLKTNDLPKPDNAKLFGVSPNTGKAYCWSDRVYSNRAEARSKTFPGIANAMAEQWGDLI